MLFCFQVLIIPGITVQNDLALSIDVWAPTKDPRDRHTVGPSTSGALCWCPQQTTRLDLRLKLGDTTAESTELDISKVGRHVVMVHYCACFITERKMLFFKVTSNARGGGAGTGS